MKKNEADLLAGEIKRLLGLDALPIPQGWVTTSVVKGSPEQWRLEKGYGLHWSGAKGGVLISVEKLTPLLRRLEELRDKDIQPLLDLLPHFGAIVVRREKHVLSIQSEWFKKNGALRGYFKRLKNGVIELHGLDEIEDATKIFASFKRTLDRGHEIEDMGDSTPVRRPTPLTPTVV